MNPAPPDPPLLDTFTIRLNVSLRECRPDDLPALEWWGRFAADRELIRAVFDRQECGEALMLVAEANGAPCAQAWVDLEHRREAGAGVLWAVRVFPLLRGLGIGTRLIAAAEHAIRARGLVWAEITAEPENLAAQRFYARLGYHHAGQATPVHDSLAERALAEFPLTPPTPPTQTPPVEPPPPPGAGSSGQLLFRKRLVEEAGAGSGRGA